MPTYLVVQTFLDPKDAPKINPVQLRERLVEATNKASAIRHIANETITAEVAEIADAMRLAQAGVKVEKAGE